jgi:hypothetical protein
MDVEQSAARLSTVPSNLPFEAIDWIAAICRRAERWPAAPFAGGELEVPTQFGHSLHRIDCREELTFDNARGGKPWRCLTFGRTRAFVGLLEAA